MDLMNRQKNRKEYEEGIAGINNLLMGASGQRELTGWEKHGLIDSFRSNESIKNDLALSALVKQVDLLGDINSNFVSSDDLLYTLIKDSALTRKATNLSKEEIDEINDYLSFKKEIKQENISRIGYLINKLQKGGYTWLDNKNAKITNPQNEDKISKEEKKQKEEENQCLIDNTTQLNTVNQTLENFNNNIKNKTPVQWVDGQPQVPTEGYTPTPFGTSRYN